jgi:hypothetical protein
MAQPKEKHVKTTSLPNAQQQTTKPVTMVSASANDANKHVNRSETLTPGNRARIDTSHASDDHERDADDDVERDADDECLRLGEDVSEGKL